MYLSGWQVGLFADRPGTGLPDQLQTELDYFIEECSDAVLGALTPELATEGLNQLAGWLRVQGYEDSADAITNLRDRIEAPTRRPFPGSIPKWGMSDGPYFTYRGAVISPFFDRVQRYFAEKLAAQDSPDGS